MVIGGLDAMDEPTTLSAENAQTRRARVSARLDRLPVWGLSPLVYVVLGLCYLLCFYDISVIGVTLPSITASLHLTGSGEQLPIIWNLVGYMVGAFGLGNVADRLGRRRTLAIVVVVLTVAAVLTAFSQNAVELAIFRFIAGIGIGAQITLSATLIGEFAPAPKRGRYIALNIVWASVGNMLPAVVGVGLLGGTGDTGWRVMLGLVGLVIFTLFLFRDRMLPESPRWLAAHGDLEKAERLVDEMEQRVQRKTGTELPGVPDLPADEEVAGFPTAALLRRPYLPRTLVVLGFWFALYFAIYAFLGYQTTLIGKLSSSLPSAVLITAVGFAGGVLGAAVQPLFIDRIERKHNVMMGLGVFAVGFVLLAVASGAVLVTAGSFLASMGLYFTLVPAYTYTAEVFPTRARGAAMGVGDGLGHAGGAIQPLAVVPLLAAAGPRPVFWMMAAAVVVAGLIMTAGMRTNRRPLTELAQ